MKNGFPRHLARLALCLGALLATPPALAQQPLAEPATRDAARQLGYEGIDAYEAGDLATATERLDRAYALLPTPGLAYWSGVTLRDSGRLAEAAERFRAATRLSDPEGDPAVQEQAKRDAQAAYDELIPRVPRMTVFVFGVEPDSVAIQIDGKPMPPELEGFAQAANPGEHIIVGKLGDQVVTQRVALVERATAPVVVNLEFEPVPEPQPEPVTDEGSTGSRRKAPWQRTAGWIGIGAGASGLAAWGIVGAMALGEDGRLTDECPNDSCPVERHDDVRTFRGLRTASTVGFVVGALGVATGVTLLATAPKEPRVSLRFDGTTVRLRGNF